MPRRERVHPKHRGIYVVTLAGGREKYHLRVTLGGKQTRLTFDDLQEAVAKREELLGLAPTVRRERRANVPVDDVFLAHLLTYVQFHREEHTQGDKPNLKESTVHGYRKTVDYHLARWATKHRWSAATVSLEQMRDFCKHAGSNGNAAFTNAAKICQVVGRSLVELNFRSDNPATGLNAHAQRRSTRTSRSRITSQHATGSGLWIPTWAEIEKILEHVEGDLHVLWFQMLALTGLRPEEAAGLHWDRDVDLDRRTVRPNEPLVEINGKRILLGVDVNDDDAGERIDAARDQQKAGGKTPKWLRPVPIVDQLLPVLGRLESDYRSDEQPWVFPGRRTAKARASALGAFPISYEFTQTVFRKASRAEGFDGVRQYDLRHYLASVLINTGSTYEQVAKILGNSAATVEAAYSHLRRSDVDDLRDMMSGALARDRTPGSDEPSSASIR